MKTILVFVLIIGLCAAIKLYRPKQFMSHPVTTGEGDPCESPAAQECADDYVSCVNNTSSEDLICACLGNYGYCLYSCMCLDDDAYNQFIDSCVNDVDCPASDCGTPVSTGSMTTGTQQCDNNDIIDCVETFSDCTDGKTTQDEICECYGDYGYCLESFNCLYGALYDAFVEGCQEQGCSDDICYASSTSTSSTSGSFSTTSDSCGEYEYECSDNYYACTNGSSDMDTVCLCYGDYGFCMWEFNCINDDEYNNFINQCEAAGCPADDCGDSPTTTGSVECTTDQIDQCVDDYDSCINSTSTLDDICNCYGEYGACLYFDGCFMDSDFNTFVKGCENAGCSSDECNPYDLTSGTTGGLGNQLARNQEGGNGDAPKRTVHINVPKPNRV